MTKSLSRASRLLERVENGLIALLVLAMVLFAAAMGSIPTEIIEAATLDGAGRLVTLWRIVLPLLRDTVQVAFVYLGVILLEVHSSSGR